MPSRPFESLSHRLLRAGIAPRRVRRLRAELTDHLLALEGEFAAAGVSASEAGRLARLQLGDDAAIADAVIARKELWSFPRRHPVLSFVAAPIPVLAIAILAAGALSEGIASAVLSFGVDGAESSGFATLASVLFSAVAYGVSPLMAAAYCMFALRRRCSWHWPLLACVMMSLFGAFLYLAVTLPTADGGAGTVLLGLTPVVQIPRLALPLAVFTAYALMRWCSFGAHRFGSLQ